MKLPSDAQAALLACIQTHDQRAEEVFVCPPDRPGSRVALVVERDDHGPLHGVQFFVHIAPLDATTVALMEADLPFPRGVTVKACERQGWVRRYPLVTRRSQRVGTAWLPEPVDHDLHPLELTEDGVIAVGLWRQRAAADGPAPLPMLTDREREIVEMAQRALELGYGLAAREPARAQARRMRRAGWFERDGAWIANSATALIPSSSALVEVRPDAADQAPEAIA